MDHDLPLSPDQEAEAQRLYDIFQPLFLEEARHLARHLAGKGDGQLLGPNEFDLRDAAHGLAAQALQAALNGRKKGATAVRA